MKRLAVWAGAATALVLLAGATEAFAQGTFKIPFQFQAGGTKLAKGEYRVTPKDDSHLTLRQVSSGKEYQVAFTKRLAQPSPPLAEPQLVFDVVGNFAPSYTEYVTDYVLAEVWLPGADGFLVHTTKGGHKTQTIKGQTSK
ncbi:MAG TPA: hypothetical protein VFD30_12805 [Terriglobia bacterium]|jgi:hypothetical protein|nr:hypothetical protein [Terriglobia bacterium]